MTKLTLEPCQRVHATPFNGLAIGSVFFAGTSNILYMRIPLIDTGEGVKPCFYNVVSLLHGNLHKVQDAILTTPVVAQIRILRDEGK